MERLDLNPFAVGFRTTDDGRMGVALNVVRLTLNVRLVAFNASVVGLGTTDDRRLQGRECGQFVFIRWLEVACVYFHFLRADDYRCNYSTQRSPSQGAEAAEGGREF